MSGVKETGTDEAFLGEMDFYEMGLYAMFERGRFREAVGTYPELIAGLFERRKEIISVLLGGGNSPEAIDLVEAGVRRRIERGCKKL